MDLDLSCGLNSNLTNYVFRGLFSMAISLTASSITATTRETSSTGVPILTVRI